jgi:hypothetical protein
MIWSDLAAQGANLKNSFLEELQTLAEGVEVRLDWENPLSYPDAQSTDSYRQPIEHDQLTGLSELCFLLGTPPTQHL